MDAVSAIIGNMRAVAPPGQRRLDDDVLAELRELTRALIAARTGAAEEHARFLAIAERGLCLPEAELAGRLRDATVMVTGGTGCIGSVLISQLVARGSGRVISVSRGISNEWPTDPAAEYRRADVRDRAAMDALIGTLTAMLVLAAGLGVLNTVVLDTRERVHELGIVKALGMTPRQTVTMVLTSIAGIGLIAGAIGVPIGVALHRYVLPIMAHTTGENLPHADIAVYQPVALAALVVGGLIIAMTGALLPAGWAAAVRPSTALHTE